MKKPIVSRSMTVTEVRAEVIHLLSEETTDLVFVLPRTYRNDIQLEKALVHQIPTNMKLVRILEVKVARYIYAMSEQTFLDHAQKISGYSAAETRKLFDPPA